VSPSGVRFLVGTYFEIRVRELRSEVHNTLELRSEVMGTLELRAWLYATQCSVEMVQHAHIAYRMNLHFRLFLLC